MSLQHVVATMLAGFSLFLLANWMLFWIKRRRLDGAGAMAVVNAGVLVAYAAALWLAPQHVGIAVAAISIPFVVAPLVMARISASQSARGDNLWAARTARAAALLHPARTFRFNAAYTRAMAIEAHDGKLAALEALKRDATSAEAVTLETTIRRTMGDWPAVLALVTAGTPQARGLGWLEVRALGELGRLDEMVAAYARHKPAQTDTNSYTGALFVLAFSGRTAAVAALLSGPLAHLTDDAKDYWRLIAALAADPDSRSARTDLDIYARSSPHEASRLAAQAHLQRAAAGAIGKLAPDTAALVDAIEAEEHAASRGRSFGVRNHPATWLLTAILALVFLLQIARGGAQDIETLVELGALWPPLVTEHGEWWRIGAAMFLHLGWLHYLLNAFVLLSLGAAVEQRLGAVRTLIAYLVTGLAANAIMLGLMSSGIVARGVLVGASGALLGLVGVLVVDQVAHYRLHRDEAGQMRLINLVLLVAIQALADFLTPMVSFTTHALGFVSGLVVGAMLLPRHRAA